MALTTATTVFADPVISGPAVVTAGLEATFSVASGDDLPHVWEWSVNRPQAGLIVPLESKGEAPGEGKASFTAGQVVLPEEFTLQVRDARDSKVQASRIIRLLPSKGVAGPLDAFLGMDWKRPAPRMTPFAGPLASAGTPGGPVFSGITKIAFLDDPALGPLFHRHWVVGDGRGIQFISARGEARRLGADPLESKLSAPEPFTCVALAACAPGTPKEAPIHLAWAPAGTLGSTLSHSVYAMDALGRVSLLTGGSGRGHRDGPAADAQFKGITDLAMDSKGNLFILDAGNRSVRVLSREGQVTTLAGGGRANASGHDGVRTGASFLHPMAMAVDRATGDLYVLDCHAVRKVTPEGRVTTLLGSMETTGSGFQPMRSGRKTPAGVPCLNMPKGIAIRGRNLFIADTGNHTVEVFDLDTRMFPVLMGDRSLTAARSGLLGLCPLTERAALPRPLGIAFNPEGVCMAVSATDIVELDFPAPPA